MDVDKLHFTDYTFTPKSSTKDLCGANFQLFKLKKNSWIKKQLFLPVVGLEDSCALVRNLTVLGFWDSSATTSTL